MRDLVNDLRAHDSGVEFQVRQPDRVERTASVSLLLVSGVVKSKVYKNSCQEFAENVSIFYSNSVCRSQNQLLYSAIDSKSSGVIAFQLTG